MAIKIHMYLFVFIAYLFYQKKLEIYFLFYISVLIHEIAHIVVSLLLGVEVTTLYLLPFGANAKYQEPMGENKEILISLAGPLMSLFLAIFSHHEWVCMANYCIMMFNMIPIYPLDGGRIWKCFLVKKYGYQKGMQKSRLWSDFFLVILFILALVFGWKYHRFQLLLLVAYLFSLSKSEMKKERLLRIINYLQTEE